MRTERELREAEEDAVFELRRRLRRLRRLVLLPLSLLSAAIAPPVFLLYRDYQLEAQWAHGHTTAHYVPLWTGAVASVPAVLCFGVAVLVYRAIRARRLELWKAELCRAHGLSDGQLDDIGSVFH